MTKQEILDCMYAYEQNHGESFVDRLGYLFPTHIFMSWALGKGYLTTAQYKLWFEAWKVNELEAEDMNYFLYDDEYEEDDNIPFALVSSDGFNDEDGLKAYTILAEFIFETDIYIAELKAELK